jgi:hypothetical protein
MGFEQRKPGVFSSSISEEVIGWIGLNKAICGLTNAVEINPVVGVRNQRIERLVADLVGDTFNNLVPPTIAGNVGYFSPVDRYLAFTFFDSGPNEEIADRLCEAVKVHGLPFMEKASDLRTLVEMMQTVRFGMTEQLNYRIPVGFWLLADIEKAKIFIAAKVSEISSREDPAALRYRTFATRLNELIGL